MKLITKEIENRLKKFPLYSQDGKGAEATIIAKFFLGAFTWYVLEGSIENKENGYTFFGIVDVNGEKEYGYFTQKELESVRARGIFPVERDMYFKPCKVSALN